MQSRGGGGGSLGPSLCDLEGPLIGKEFPTGRSWVEARSASHKHTNEQPTLGRDFANWKQLWGS